MSKDEINLMNIRSAKRKQRRDMLAVFAEIEGREEDEPESEDTEKSSEEEAVVPPQSSAQVIPENLFTLQKMEEYYFVSTDRRFRSDQIKLPVELASLLGYLLPNNTDLYMAIENATKEDRYTYSQLLNIVDSHPILINYPNLVFAFKYNIYYQHPDELASEKDSNFKQNMFELLIKTKILDPRYFREAKSFENFISINPNLFIENISENRFINLYTVFDAIMNTKYGETYCQYLLKSNKSYFSNLVAKSALWERYPELLKDYVFQNLTSIIRQRFPSSASSISETYPNEYYAFVKNIYNSYPNNDFFHPGSLDILKIITEVPIIKQNNILTDDIIYRIATTKPNISEPANSDYTDNNMALILHSVLIIRKNILFDNTLSHENITEGLDPETMVAAAELIATNAPSTYLKLYLKGNFNHSDRNLNKQYLSIATTNFINSINRTGRADEFETLCKLAVTLPEVLEIVVNNFSGIFGNFLITLNSHNHPPEFKHFILQERIFNKLRTHILDKFKDPDLYPKSGFNFYYKYLSF